MKTIFIDNLLKIDGLTTNFAKFLSEAVVYALSISKHQNGKVLMFDNRGNIEQIALKWSTALPSSVQSSWNDEQELTEFAATGLAISLVMSATDFTFVKRAKRGSGWDYFLGRKIKNNLPVLNGLLEISGILQEKKSNLLSSRVYRKILQIQKGNTNLTTYVIVVEFGQPKAKFIKVI